MLYTPASFIGISFLPLQCNSMIRLTEKLLGDYAAAGSPSEIPVLQTVVLSPQGGKGLVRCHSGCCTIIGCDGCV